MKRFRVMMQGEDGVYCLKDGLLTPLAAERYANSYAPLYGEGQELFIEEYTI